MANCLTCGVDTSNLKFCSRSCAAKHNNHISPKRTKRKRTCVSCQQLIHKEKGMLCVECLSLRRSTKAIISDLPFSEIRLLTLRDIQKRYGERSFGRNRNAAVRHYASILNPNLKKDFGMCQVCGYSTHVELCHIKAISTFSDDATLEEINGEQNLLILCKNHHWEFNHDVLSLEAIPPRKPPALIR